MKAALLVALMLVGCLAPANKPDTSTLDDGDSTAPELPSSDVTNQTNMLDMSPFWEAEMEAARSSYMNQSTVEMEFVSMNQYSDAYVLRNTSYGFFRIWGDETGLHCQIEIDWAKANQTFGEERPLQGVALTCAISTGGASWSSDYWAHHATNNFSLNHRISPGIPKTTQPWIVQAVAKGWFYNETWASSGYIGAASVFHDDVDLHAGLGFDLSPHLSNVLEFPACVSLLNNRTHQFGVAIEGGRGQITANVDPAPSKFVDIVWASGMGSVNLENGTATFNFTGERFGAVFEVEPEVSPTAAIVESENCPSPSRYEVQEWSGHIQSVEEGQIIEGTVSPLRLEIYESFEF